MTQSMVLMQHLRRSKALSSTYVSVQTGKWKNKYMSECERRVSEWVSKQASKQQTNKQTNNQPDWLTNSLTN
jgi:hypothetical protein